MAGLTHWLDDPEYRQPGNEHINVPRMSAATIQKLVELKNSLMGTNRTVYEESLLAKERGDQPSGA